MDSDEQYSKICGPRMESMEQKINDTKSDIEDTKHMVSDIHEYLFRNGLQSKVQRNSIYIAVISGILACIGTVSVWKFFDFII